MNGIHEVRGSIPLGSTKFLIPELPHPFADKDSEERVWDHDLLTLPPG